jgi:hypothetical protein
MWYGIERVLSLEVLDWHNGHCCQSQSNLNTQNLKCPILDCVLNTKGSIDSICPALAISNDSEQKLC